MIFLLHMYMYFVNTPVFNMAFLYYVGIFLWNDLFFHYDDSDVIYFYLLLNFKVCDNRSYFWSNAMYLIKSIKSIILTIITVFRRNITRCLALRSTERSKYLQAQYTYFVTRKAAKSSLESAALFIFSIFSRRRKCTHS